MAYPLSKFLFRVEWDGARAGFTEVSGLSSETEIIEYREGDNPEISKTKMPGMKKYGNITLKRGVVSKDNNFFEWWDDTEEEIRRNITISMINSKNEPLVTWQVINAWPVKMDSGDLKADGNEVSIETLELAHEGIRVEHA